MDVNRSQVFGVFLIAFVSLIYTLPNFFQDSPVLILNHKTSESGLIQSTIEQLQPKPEKKLLSEVKSSSEIADSQSTTLYFSDVEAQLSAKTKLEKSLGKKVSIDLNLFANTPSFLQWFYAKPMRLGLDLRGGVHLLLEVDVSKQENQLNRQTLKDILESLRSQSIAYKKATINHGHAQITFFSDEERAKALRFLSEQFRQVQTTQAADKKDFSLHIKESSQLQTNRTDYLVQKTLESIQNRVNELGVSEAVVARQGEKQISVDLPGIQDINQAKQLLGNTASLRFHLVKRFVNSDEAEAIQDKTILLSSNDGFQAVIDPHALLTGDAISYAVAGVQEGKPVIQVQLSDQDTQKFYNATQANIGRPMAIILSESQKQSTGSAQRTVTERIISAPTIRDALKHSFVISGTRSQAEADTLAMLLRSGSLAAPVDIVSQSTIGPSLGADNIQKGVASIFVGLAFIMLFMVMYYKKFGLIANLALLLNLTLMVMALSWIEATLTLPAMAALILSVGMAVDANVLINERIREELRLGKPDQTATLLGYDKAFSSIFDANITTFIVAFLLYCFSSGLIKGFAITLMIGLACSMYTSVYVTRTLTFAWFKKLGPVSKAIGV